MINKMYIVRLNIECLINVLKKVQVKIPYKVKTYDVIVIFNNLCH